MAGLRPRISAASAGLARIVFTRSMRARRAGPQSAAAVLAASDQDLPPIARATNRHHARHRVPHSGRPERREPLRRGPL